MDVDVGQGIIRSVQQHVERIVLDLGLDARDYTIKVRRMGSREYGCAGESSDLDLYVMVPDSWALHAKHIRILVAAALEATKQAKDV